MTKSLHPRSKGLPASLLPGDDLPGSRELTGREYLRVSEDRSKRMKSPAQQHEDNERACAAHRITLGEPYREGRAVSASRYSTDVRDDFDRLMTDLRSGEFGADVLVLWESSRGSRRVLEWVTMLDLLERQGILVFVTTHGRLYDPANPRDRRGLIDDANDSEYESAKIAQRIRRDMAANAAEGRPHGLCPVGLRPVYHERTGKLITWEADPDTAPMIVDLFTLYRRGRSGRSIAREFEERGYRNKRGNPYTHAHLRDMATKAAYTGLRVHHGELIEGTWDAIVERDLWWDVQRILAEPAHQSTAPRFGSVKHEYTRTMRCAKCLGPITTLNSKRGDYMCQNGGCARITKAPVDKILNAVIEDFLAQGDFTARVAHRVDTPQIRALETAIARLRAELEEAENAVPANVSEARMFARIIEDIKPKLADKQAQLRGLTSPSELASLLAPEDGSPAADAVTRWRDAPVEVRRKIAKILLSPQYLGQVRINPKTPGKRLPAHERLTWVRDAA
ncbi:recombinase family protein [Herbidospora yilanensis]|uniref:recombinase family protein n=1 Tax=Herbidospora yilanensis TaxID=354426 RepID=UPI0009FCAACE|nr:recombinase family protein [Herbidospora yilanensis]